jgi:hypothetical protein
MSGFDGKKVVVIAAIAFGVLQGGLAGVAHLSRRSLQDQLEAERQRLEQLEENYEQAQRSEQPVRPESRQPAWQLLDGPDVVQTLQQLQVIGDEVGLTFDTQKAVRSAEAGKQPFLLSGHATAGQVAAFVAAVERSQRLMVLETGRVTPAGGDQVAFEFGLATYHQGEQR